MRKPRKRKKKQQRARPQTPSTTPAIDLDQLWQRVRSGAANVAGVRYQLVVTALLLADARGALRIEEVTPEGFEDIDCRLSGGETLLVQTKERAAGEARIGLAGIAAAVEHAAEALRADRESRFALVTDAEFSGDVSETGFVSTLAELLPGAAGALAVHTSLAESELDDFVKRVHLVRVPWADAPRLVQELLERNHAAPPAVAALSSAVLIDQLGSGAADQRGRGRSTAIRFRPSELDALVHRVSGLVDLDTLSAPERNGSAEPVDFTRPLAIPVERFLLGLDVEPGHIAAGLDVIRPGELELLFSALEEDRYTLIAGPSGAGKSALLWRSTFELGGRFRLLRVRRTLDEDIADLVRYVEAQMPTEWAPLLVCADDLGRPSMVGWEELVDRLVEIPGVYLIGAVREEDFSASLLRGRAQVIRPKLDQILAAEVVAQLRSRDVLLQLEPPEALRRARGLLMEFLALLVSGRRLEAIVRAQADERLSPDRTCEREVLRFVCTAHARGLALAANVLPMLVSEPNELQAALSRLEAEFVLRKIDSEHWGGLHELRSRVVKDRLHELPPPTESESVARLLPLVAASERRTLIVSAAVEAVDMTPIADAADQLLAQPLLGAAATSEILDGLIEAEEIDHARACLAFLRQRAPHVDAQALLPLFQLIKDEWVEFGTDLPNGVEINALAAALPDRPPSLAEKAAGALPPDELERMISEEPLEAVIDLLELLVFLGGKLTVAAAEVLISRASSSDLPLYARAVSASAVASSEAANKLAELAGPVNERLDVIAAARRDILRIREVRAADAHLVSVEVFADGEGKLNDRLVDICRLIYDLCPEVDQVDAVALATDGGESVHPDSHKSPSRKYLMNPRRELRRNIVFDESIQRLVAADSWTERLRLQERVVADLARLLEDAIPRLINAHDNEARRRSWNDEVERTRQEAGRLPAVPLPPSGGVNRSDPSKDVIGRVTLALTQLSQGVMSGELDNLLGIGSQLQGAFGKDPLSGDVTAEPGIEEWPIVRRLGQQVDGLRERTDLLAALLLALERDRALLHSVSKHKAGTWVDAASLLVSQVRDDTLAEEEAVIQAVLAGCACDIRVLPDTRPGEVRLVADRWLVSAEPEHWLEASQRLLALPDEAALALGFRTYAVAAIDGVGFPLFARMFGQYNGSPFLYPVDPVEAAEIVRRAELDVFDSPIVDQALATFQAVVHASSLVAHVRLRDPRLDSEAEREAARVGLEAAKAAVAGIKDVDLRRALGDALKAVESELAGDREGSLAGELERSALTNEENEGTTVAATIVLAAVDAGLRERGDL